MQTATRSVAAFRAVSPFQERSDRAGPRIEVFDSFEAAKPLWERLERAVPHATPYQRYKWLANWDRHVGQANRLKPLIAVGMDEDPVPLFILPLISEQYQLCTVASFGGGSHSNLNMPIWRPDVAASITRRQVRNLLRDIARAAQIDLFVLLGQPLAWRDVPNPFASLPCQPSPDDVFFNKVDPASSEFKLRLPKIMREKERKLMRLPNCGVRIAETTSDVERVLGAFWLQKAARFAKLGIRNVFDEPGVQNFIRAACLDGLDEGKPTIDLFSLEGGGEILAAAGGVRDRDRYSVMFNSITTGSRARLSPGIILFAKIISECARRGVDVVDFGAGQATYKEFFSIGRERRVDSFVPASIRGHILAPALRALHSVKRTLKTNPVVMSALQTARQWSGARAIAMPSFAKSQD